MGSQVTINPLLTSNAAGSFNTTSNGLIVGTAYGDPSSRNYLSGGVLSASAALPMWGGVGISEDVPTPWTPSVPTGRDPSLGGNVDRATLLANLTGFAVFDQNYAAINSPQSPVPLTPGGGLVNFYRFGSNARVALEIDPALITLDGGLITQQVSWDFEHQRIVKYAPVNAAIPITSQTWSAGVVTVVTSAAHTYVVGDVVNLSGAAPAPYNGAKTLLTVADNTHFTYALATDPGTSPAATPGQVDAGGGAINVRILEVKSDNCMAPVYDPATGFATWNRNAAAAVVLL